MYKVFAETKIENEVIRLTQDKFFFFVNIESAANAKVYGPFNDYYYAIDRYCLEITDMLERNRYA